jgi:hypothetical protein
LKTKTADFRKAFRQGLPGLPEAVEDNAFRRDRVFGGVMFAFVVGMTPHKAGWIDYLILGSGLAELLWELGKMAAEWSDE